MFKFPTDGLVYIVKAVKKRKPGNKVWYKINLLDFVFRYNRLWIFNLQKTTGIVNYCIYLSETDICWKILLLSFKSLQFILSYIEWIKKIL